MMHRVVVFAKRPRAGHVKTRLVPPLSAEQAARLHRAFVVDLLNRLITLEVSVELCCDEPWPDPLPERVALTQQGPGDLGERLLLTVVRSADEGAQETVVLGADAPTVPLESVAEALRRVSKHDDAVIVPAADGGYVLIGMGSPAPALFDDIPWGGSEVSATTRRRAEDAGLQLHELPEWYDVDDAASLDRLRQELATASGRRLAPITAAFLDALDADSSGVV